MSLQNRPLSRSIDSKSRRNTLKEMSKTNDNFFSNNNKVKLKSQSLQKSKDKQIIVAQNISAFDRKVKKIKEELQLIDPETLLLKVDPTLVHAPETIEQIQKYHILINSEIEKYYHNERAKNELMGMNDELNKSIQEIIKVKKPNYLRQSAEDKELEKKKENKPIIDYRVKIRSLEKEIMYTYQDLNNTSSKNELLIQKLNEMRKLVIQKTKKLEDLKKELETNEKNYYAQKSEIEKNLSNRKENEDLDKIKQNQKKLEKINNEMVQKIKETDKFIVEKEAKKKCLEFEEHQLEKLAEDIEKKNQKELNKFNKQYEEDIKKVNNYDDSSKIIDMLDKEKITSLKELLNDMLNETKTENIQQFVEYFIKSCEEYKTFQDSILILSKTVSDLEKEVNDLDYIINFCEENLNVKNDKNLDDDELKEIDDLKFCSDKFIELQYNAINTAYKNFVNELMDLLAKYQPQLKNEENYQKDFLKFYADYLNTAQDQFKKVASIYKKNKKNEFMNNNDIFDFNKWDSKWEKVDKIKENVRKDYIRAGPGNAKFEIKNVKDLVKEIMLKGERK